MTSTDSPEPKPIGTTPTPEILEKGERKLREMLEQARSGDKSVIPLLREFFQFPGMSDRFGGNLAWDSMQVLVGEYAGKDLARREAVLGKLRDLRYALLRDHENPTITEELLIERVVATWLHLHHLEMLYAGLTETKLSMCMYYEKAISAAQQRYFAALDLLASQRKVALPPVQINVANKQVNVAGNVSAAAANETPAPLG